MYQHSIAMSETTHKALISHLLRATSEDICLATYAPSTEFLRTSRIFSTVELPGDRDRRVHGNATITGDFVLRIAADSAREGRGVAILHSHPRGSGWQPMSSLDADAESSYARLVQQLTGLPLVGMTLAGDQTCSARVWIHRSTQWPGPYVGRPLPRDVLEQPLVPSLADDIAQPRSISAWGERLHRDITRLRVLVVGVGSLGLDVAQPLVASGILEFGVMDFDRVVTLNRDR